MDTAFVENHRVTPDTYPPLFDWFFETEAFKCWRDGAGSWTLHVSGGPGCGKTTLSTLVAEHLRTSPSTKDPPLATVFLRKDASADDTDLIDAVLRSIASQVGVASVALEPTAQTCPRHAIREALHFHVAACRRAFVILDDMDLIRHWHNSPLQKELASLQQRGLKVMVSSRLQSTDKPLDCTCDADPCQHAGELLKVYWECRDCGFICCDTCHTGGAKCYCGTKRTFIEPYNAVECYIGRLNDFPMKDFITWNIEQTHGVQGLRSPIQQGPVALSAAEECRCLSPMGASIEAQLKPVTVVDDVVLRADGNIAMARLRLDNLHVADSIETLFEIKDRIPRNIIGMFDLGVQHIEKGSIPKERELGLWSLVAVTDGPVAVEQVTQLVLANMIHRDQVDNHWPTLDALLRAANGFLTLRMSPSEIWIADTYHEDFRLYLKENYSGTLSKMRSSLRLT